MKVNNLKYKTSDLPSTPTKDYNLPALTAGIQNQGLNNYVPQHGATILNRVISISANGANTGATFYQSKKFTVLQDAYAINWKDKKQNLSDNLYLYMTGVISKSIYGNYEWTNKASWEKVKNQIIKLPIKNNEIDFEFIESFVAELEAQRVAELEAQRVAELESYLQVTGLKDYELTEEEESVLYTKVDFKEFKIGDLFEKLKVNNLKYKTSDLSSTPTKDYNLPALTAGIQNQGLNNYVPQHGATILNRVISISANGANTGATFYQSKKFTVLQDAYAINWKDKKQNLSDNLYLYMTGVISKSIYGNYEWTNKAGWERIKSNIIHIPTFKNKIDFDYMDTLISAIKKLVIKDVVKYADNKISATRKVINKE